MDPQSNATGLGKKRPGYGDSIYAVLIDKRPLEARDPGDAPSDTHTQQTRNEARKRAEYGLTRQHPRGMISEE